MTKNKETKMSKGKKEQISGKYRSSSKSSKGSTLGPDDQDVGFGQGFLHSKKIRTRQLKQVKIKNNLLMPNLPMDYPKSWKKDVKSEEEEFREEYLKKGLIPFFNTIKRRRVSNKLYSVKDLRSKIEKVDIAVEKTALLSKDEKNLNYGSFGGQNIQAKTDGQIFRGLYNQEAKKNQIHQFFKTDVLKVDSDDTGHYLALMNQLYSGKKPKEIYFGGKKGDIDLTRANRFLAQQIISSLSYQRNKAIQDAIKASLGEVKLKEDLDTEGVFSPLGYRDSSGKIQDLSVSEEQLAITYKIFNEPISINVHLIDKENPIEFEYHGENLNEKIKPVLRFDLKGGEVERLDSDTLLAYAVSELNLEPDAVQNLLEGLYQQGWINYPRADTLKAKDEPLYLLRDIKNFKGTEYEKRLLTIIDESDKAYKEKKPYIESGNWVLDQGIELKTKGFKLITEPNFYNEEAFDITLQKGLSPIKLTDFLTDPKKPIATPATRTSILSALKEAGIISLDKNRKYQLDRRGLYFASCYEFFEENGIELGIDLKNELDSINDIEKMVLVVNKFDVVDRKSLKEFIKLKADEVLEQQSDLTILESY